jgi:hypothetical protein
MQFNADQTFSIYEIIVPPNLSSSSSSDSRGGDDSRNDFDDDTRTGSFSQSSSSFVPTTITHLFGEQSILNGQWSFDTSGKVFGFYGESIGQVCTPTTFTVTTTTNFPDGSIGYATNTVTITNCVGTTNGVNFIGSVAPGKRLTLKATSNFRKFTFSGLPFLTLTNIAGSYNGTRIKQGQTTYEIFTLSASVTPNVYDVFGGSGDYSYNDIGGHALLSRWGKIAFALPLDPDGTQLRATIGGFDRLRLRFSTQGVEQPSGALIFVRFNGALAPTGP